MPESFQSYADRWLVRRTRELAARTLETYRDRLVRQVYPLIGDVILEHLTRRLLCQAFDYWQARGYAARTTRLACAIVTARGRRRMGHASIETTIGTYASHLPIPRSAVQDEL